MRHLAKIGGVLLAGAMFIGGPASAAQPDAWITTKAKMSLLTADGVSVTDVNVDTVNGVVTLHGKVDSEAEKSKAEAAVKGIEGVQQVRNLLQIVPEQRENAVSESDDKLKDRVAQALKNDKSLTNVDVQSVNSGVVLLSGTVETLSAHLRVIETASRVPGVRRVASEIKSPDKLADAEIYADEREMTASADKGGITGGIKDRWITSSVKMRLIADDRTPGMGVNVDTNDGQVTLFGMVDSATAKAAAEEDAKKVSGVRSVRNELQVVAAARQAAVKEDDKRVEQRVEDAISREMRDAKIDVDVQNGVARLSGTVPSQEERLRAAVVARTATGVKAVRDDLRVASR